MRWRQLVELVARASSDSDRDLLDQALAEIREGSRSVEERVRTAAALVVAPLSLPVGLVAAFASDTLAVAAPILASARLTTGEWKQVEASASAECRSFIRALGFDEPRASNASSAAAPAEPAHSVGGAAGEIPSISEVVARIERLRHAREEEQHPDHGGSGNQAETPRLFRWECNDNGEIDWVDGAARGAVIGQSIAHCGSHGVDRSVERAFASRTPFEGGTLELAAEGSSGGTWKISGVPAFEPSTGRFAGYQGVAERPSGALGATSMRELAHEIRTPLNAIIGFAEMITGEYLGPADERLRQRAGEIIAQARLLQHAVEDLDMAAQRRAAKKPGPALHLGELVEELVGDLRERAWQRQVELHASRSTLDLTIAMERSLAERLIERMCNAVIDRAVAGEHLRLAVTGGSNNRCIVSISRPDALASLSDDEVFGSADDGSGETLPLRLARGLATAAGVELAATDHALELRFPRA